MNDKIFPLCAKNFLTKQCIDYLLDWTKNNDRLHDQHKSDIEYWAGKCIYFNEIENIDVKNIIYEISQGMLNIITASVPDEKNYIEPPQFVRWREGDLLTPHADNIEQDGITPNKSPHRTYGGVVYLNDDFEGGEIYYPNLNIQVKPEPGMLVIHPADLKFTHGVKKVESGIRYTISAFFTHVESYSIDNYYHKHESDPT
jgi:predicted 2-oxoglutarate/Fe(II)-dependent dioxygenase YbiX